MKSKRLITRVISAVIATSMILGGASSAFATGAIGNEATVTSLEEALKIVNNLSAEEKEILRGTENSQAEIDGNIDIVTEEVQDVIIEFEQDPVVVTELKQSYGIEKSTTSASDLVKESHEAFEAHLEDLKKSARNNDEDGEKVNSIEVNEYYSEVFNGVSITTRGDAVEVLSEIPGVKKIWKDEEVWAIPQETTEISTTSDIDGFMQDSVPHIGVDKLHEEGITGKGVKVGVLDTGIDYNHPDLDGAYKGYRFTEGEDPASVDPDSVLGWDFIDNDADPMETTYEDWQNSGYVEFDPSTGSSYYTYHGTHVSGTIVGQGKNDVDYSVLGVAPDADLYVYRVLGPYGSGSTSGVLAGIEKAVTDGMDVINLSLGAAVNDPSYPTTVAVDNATLAGVTVVSSAGNSGRSGYATVGSPGGSALGISVGASDTTRNVEMFNSKVGEVNYDLKGLAKNYDTNLQDIEGNVYELVDVGYGLPSDYEGKDMEGKVAFISRGESTFQDKITTASQMGAELAIIYNNVDGEIEYYFGRGNGYIDTFKLTQEEGLAIKELLDSEEVVEIKLDTLTTFTIEGDNLADFSSLGPVYGTEDIKPDVVAPGVDTFSTFPYYMSSDEEDYTYAYRAISGTSMAAPHVAGVAALMLQNNPDMSPFDIKVNLMNTGEDLSNEYSVYEIGAGRVNAYEAVHNDVEFRITDENGGTNETGSIRYGSVVREEGSSLSETREINITNNSSETKNFNVDVEFTSTSVVERKAGRYVIDIQDAVSNGVTLDIDKKVTLDSNGETNLSATLNVPSTAEAGVYEGVIKFTDADSGQVHRVPFALNVLKEGFAWIEVGKNAVYTDTTLMHGTMYSAPFTDLYYTLNNDVDEMYAFLKDTDTQEYVGVLFNVDGEEITPGVTQVKRSMFFWGEYFAFTNGVVDTTSSTATQGMYEVELVGLAGDKEYVTSTMMAVDNSAPELNIDDYQLLYEISEDDFTWGTNSLGESFEGYWFDFSTYDKTVDELNEAGIYYDMLGEVNQTRNDFLGVFIERVIYGFSADENGNGKLGIPKDDFEYTTEKYGAYNLSFYTSNYATGGERFGPLPINIVAEGAPYSYLEFEKEQVGLGDEVNISIGFNRVEDFVKGEYEFNLSIFPYYTIDASEELKQYAEENGMSVKVDQGWGADRKVTVELVAEDGEVVPYTGSMDMIEISAHTDDMIVYERHIPIVIQGSSYTNEAGETIPLGMSRGKVPEFKVEQTHLSGALRLGGTEGTVNLANYGAEIYMIDPNGDRIDIDVPAGGYYEAFIPSIEGEYTIVFDMPGYLQQTFKREFVTVIDGEPQITISEVINTTLTPGDVNGDGVIDLLDVIEVTNHIEASGEYDGNLDINKDGIIDELDLAYIYLNYGEVNDNSLKPVYEKDGATLEDYLYGPQKYGKFTQYLNLSGDDTFIPGEQFRVQLKQFEMDNKGTDRWFDIIVAQYDDDNVMVDLDAYTSYVGGSSNYRRLNIYVTPHEDATKIKIFTVDGRENLNTWTSTPFEIHVAE